MHPDIHFLNWQEQDELLQYEVGFFGTTIGVVLSKVEDLNRIVFAFVVEDDGHWYVSRFAQYSAMFIPEAISVFNHAQIWMYQNAEYVETDSISGWRFKS